jgi:LPXTG-site transpeptidase (sortase) family protein
VAVDVSDVVALVGLPTRLQIPKIQVDTAIQPLGLTKAGDLDVPSTIVEVGWYKLGSRPGNTGAAVIDGHLDGLHGQPGVFANLKRLQKGDTIVVIDDNGTTITFQVSQIRSYSQSLHPAEVFESKSGTHLNLITCSGAWDTAQNSYDQRLVVFTDKVSSL